MDGTIGAAVHRWHLTSRPWVHFLHHILGTYRQVKYVNHGLANFKGGAQALYCCLAGVKRTELKKMQKIGSRKSEKSVATMQKRWISYKHHDEETIYHDQIQQSLNCGTKR